MRLRPPVGGDSGWGIPVEGWESAQKNGVKKGKIHERKRGKKRKRGKVVAKKGEMGRGGARQGGAV